MRVLKISLQEQRMNPRAQVQPVLSGNRRFEKIEKRETGVELRKNENSLDSVNLDSGSILKI